MITHTQLKQALQHNDTHITTNQGTYRLLDVATNHAIIENYNAQGHRHIEVIPLTTINHIN